ncbi:hypothetical protein LPJ81_000234 [Coemansia sp. IMI 209127]|nr:hypothetical protein LPJ81_000234 [Coemansia sp. IMI 209127]
MRLVELAEQSIFEHERDRQESDNEEEYWDAAGADPHAMDTDTESVGSSQSHPPDSFLEGFTREFVDAYEPSPAPVLLSPEIVSLMRFPKQSVVAGSSPEPRRRGTPPGVVSFYSSPVAQKTRYSPSAMPEPTPSPPLAVRELLPPSSHAVTREPLALPSQSATSEPSALVPQNHRLRGVAVIDTQARRRLWDRVAVAADADRHDDDERQIEDLVRMAEVLDIDRPVSEVDTMPGCSRDARYAPSDRERPTSNNSPTETTAEDLPHSHSYWQPQEWVQWGDVVAGQQQQQQPVDRGEMERRLDGVHEIHPDAWLHGFRDITLANGKLQRTYSTQPVVLQAYPDGNVKRTAQVPSDGRSPSALATTLYYANGDWSCTVPGLCCYYFYCSEHVWHEQYEDGRSVEYPLPLP